MDPIDLACLCVLPIVLVAMVLIDLAEQRLPDRLNLLLGALGLIRALYHAPTAATLAAAIAGAALTAIVLIAATRIARHFDPAGGMGRGDIKFLLAASLWVGFAGAVAVFLVAGIVTLAGVVAMRPWRRLAPHQAIPFGPMLALGLIVVVSIGDSARW